MRSSAALHMVFVISMASCSARTASDTPAAAKEDQKLREAAVAAVDAAIGSIRADPGQCTVTMHVGVMGVGGKGGPGVVGSASGGASGSTTIGVLGAAGDAHATSTAAMQAEDTKQKADAAVRVLNDLRAELVKPKPDKSTVSSRLSELAKTYLSPAATKVIEVVVSYWLKRFGG